MPSRRTQETEGGAVRPIDGRMLWPPLAALPRHGRHRMACGGSWVCRSKRAFMAVGRGARGPPLLARTRRVSSLIVTCGGSAERYIFQKNNRVATGTGTARAPPARVAVGTQLVCGYRLVARGGGWRWRGSTDRTTPFGWFRVPSRVSGRRFGPAVGSPAPAGLMRCIPTGQGGGGRISG